MVRTYVLAAENYLESILGSYQLTEKNLTET